MAEKPRSLPEPSQHIVDAVCDGDSPVADCEFCGRVHFAGGGRSDYEEGELEGLREKAKAQPEKYVEDPSNDSVGWGTIDGRQAVWNCPCHALTRYELFIWANRYKILDYLRCRAKDERAAAEEAEKAVDEVLEKYGPTKDLMEAELKSLAADPEGSAATEVSPR